MEEEKKYSAFDFIEERLGVSSRLHDYYMFEPWDVEVRPGWMYEEAKKDGFDIQSPDHVKLYGEAPHPFQSGYMQDDGFVAAMFASNQSGKSYCACMDVLIRLTGEIPIAFQYDKGVNSGVKRDINENNVKRFGRRNSATGELIDYDYKAGHSPLWDCGEIVGAGVYDKRRVAPKNVKAWIVTYKQARDESWWPLLKGMIPERMRDQSRKGGWASENDNILYLINDQQIHFITYEQGPTRLEAAGTLQKHEKLWMVLFDEEPPDSRYWATVTQRVNLIRLVTTPYLGVSWTHADILMKSIGSKDIHIYHCSKYDCPYHTRTDINRSKTTIKKWQVGARIWGLHTEQGGRPYYEDMYEQIMTALSIPEKCSYAKIFPMVDWSSPTDLCYNRDRIDLLPEYEPAKTDVWKIYEDVKPDGIYFLSADICQGTEEEGEEQDLSCAQILRVSSESEWPTQVAVLDSYLPAAEFARLCLYAAAYYNNCLLGWDACGKAAGTFQTIVDGYPFVYTMVVTNDITKKQTTKAGFFTTSKTRNQIFDYVGSMIRENIEVPGLGIVHKKTMSEIAECIVGKNGRPDHPKRKTNDSLVALGMGLYMFKLSREQIRLNIFRKKTVNDDPFDGRFAKKKETRPLLCGKGMDARKADKRLLGRF
jgi:phage terminase large subunit-like protein